MMLFRYWFWVIGILSMAAIGSALIAEYFFFLEPCSMCLKQRHPYYFILVIFVLFVVIYIFPRIWFYLGVQLASIYGLFYSIWHVGIEQKLLPGPTSCSGGFKTTNSAENLKEQIMEKTVINCEDVIWSFFSISAATINAFLLLLIFILNAIYIKKHYDSKKNTAS